MTPFARYLAVAKAVRRERGEFCEACGVSARHCHHIVPVSETGIHAALVYEPANLMILCDECHLLMHPLIRNPDWAKAGRARGRTLNRPR